MGYRKSISKRQVYSDTSLPQEKEKTQTTYLTPKGTREQRTKKHIKKIGAEINRDKKKKQKRSTKLKPGSLKRYTKLINL